MAKAGLSFRARLRGDLGVVGQEIELQAADQQKWEEAEHNPDGSHAEVTAETLDVAGVTSFGGRWLMPQSAVLTPPYTITANQNNYNPRDLVDTIWLRISTDASRDITGIVTDKDEFRHLIITNVGNSNLVLKHNSSSSIAIYRIGNPVSADVTVGSGGSVWLLYDAHSGNWRTIAFAGNVAGASGAAAVIDGDKGDVTVTSLGSVWTIDNNVVSNAKLADMAAWTIKMRNNAASGDPQDQTLADITEDTTPASGDYALGWNSAGAIRKYNWGNVAAAGYWTILTNGHDLAPELVMSGGDVISFFVPT